MNRSVGMGLFAACTMGAFVAYCGASQAQESKRTELKKGDLTGTNMEIVVGLVEISLPARRCPCTLIPEKKRFM